MRVHPSLHRDGLPSGPVLQLELGGRHSCYPACSRLGRVVNTWFVHLKPNRGPTPRCFGTPAECAKRLARRSHWLATGLRPTLADSVLRPQSFLHAPEPPPARLVTNGRGWVGLGAPGTSTRCPGRGVLACLRLLCTPRPKGLQPGLQGCVAPRLALPQSRRYYCAAVTIIEVQPLSRKPQVISLSLSFYLFGLSITVPVARDSPLSCHMQALGLTVIWVSVAVPLACFCGRFGV